MASSRESYENRLQPGRVICALLKIDNCSDLDEVSDGLRTLENLIILELPSQFRCLTGKVTGRQKGPSPFSEAEAELPCWKIQL